MKKFKIIILTLFLCCLFININNVEAKKADWQYLGTTTDLSSLKCDIYFDTNKLKWKRVDLYNKNATVFFIDTTIQTAAHNENIIDDTIPSLFVTKVHYKINVAIQNNTITKIQYKVIDFWLGDINTQEWTKQKMTDYEKRNFTTGMEKDIGLWITQKILMQYNNNKEFIDVEI